MLHFEKNEGATYVAPLPPMSFLAGHHFDALGLTPTMGLGL